MRATINKIITVIAVGLLCILTQSALAQNGAATVTGHIKDPQDANLPGAKVTLHGRERTFSINTTTDSTGVYRFEKLAAGEYLVQAEAEGFATASTLQVAVERDKTVTLDISLELASVRSTIVVTASDTPQTVDEVSKVVTVVDMKEIDERDEATITESLRTVPGLRVQQLGGPGSFTSIKTRGLRSEDTAVLIDGLRLRDSAATQGDASGLLEDLIVTDVSRVEVLRGSGSSLYGTNAIGGVINVVTDEGGGPFHGNVLGEGGGLGLFRGRGQFAGGSRDNTIIYSAGFSHLNVSKGVDGDDETRNTSGQGRVLFRLTPTTTLSGRIYPSNCRLQLSSNPLGSGT